MTCPANEERIKELEDMMEIAESKEEKCGLYAQIRDVAEADANAEKYYKKEHWEIKEIYRKQGWVSAIEWVKEQIIKINKEMFEIPNFHHCEFCDKPTEKGASHYVDMQYKRIMKILDAQTQNIEGCKDVPPGQHKDDLAHTQEHKVQVFNPDSISEAQTPSTKPDGTVGIGSIHTDERLFSQDTKQDKTRETLRGEVKA